MWFSLLGLIEHLPAEQYEEKIRLYRELLSELNPPSHEQKEVVLQVLDLAMEEGGVPFARQEATHLMRQLRNRPTVVSEALLGLARTGVDAKSLPDAREGLVRSFSASCPRSTKLFDEKTMSSTCPR